MAMRYCLTLTCHVLPLLLLLTGVWACGERGPENQGDEPARNETAATTDTSGQPLLSIQALNDTLGQRTDNPQLWYQRAQQRTRQENYRKALEDVKTALVLDSTFIDAHLLMAELYWQLAYPQGTLKALRTARRLAPENHPRLGMLLGRYLWMMKEHEASFKALNKSLEKDPYQPEVYFIKGMNYKEMVRPERAISSFQTAVELDPEYYDAYFQLGLLYLDSTGSTLGKDYLRRARKIQHGAEVSHALGDYWRLRDSLPKASGHYHRGLQMKGESASLHYNLGYVQWAQDSFEAAVRHFGLANRYAPSNKHYLYALGMARRDAGDPSGARQAFRRALELDSDFQDARQGLNMLNDGR